MDPKSQLTKLLSYLNYDFKNFTMERFVKHIEVLNNRTFHFVEWDLPPDLYGAWISDANKPMEYIFIARELPPILRTHVQLHELSHFLCGHPTLKFGAMTSTENILPLFRSGRYTSEMEIEAETLAALIQNEVFHCSLGHELSISISSAPTTVEFLKAMRLV